MVFVAILSFGRLLNAQKVQCTTLLNQTYLTGPTLIDWCPNDLCCYPFMVKLDRCGGKCSTLNKLSDRMCSKQNRRCKFKST